MNVRTQLIGADKAIRELNELGKKVRKTIGRKAVRAGGKILLDGMRANAPKRNGYFKRSLAVKPVTKGDTVMAIVGQNKKYTKTARKLTRRTMEGGISGRGFAAPIHFIEYGTKAHRIVARAKALRLAMSKASGGGVLVKSVRHPGTKGQQIVSKTERATRRQVEQAVVNKIRMELATV